MFHYYLIEEGYLLFAGFLIGIIMILSIVAIMTYGYNTLIKEYHDQYFKLIKILSRDNTLPNKLEQKEKLSKQNEELCAKIEKIMEWKDLLEQNELAKLKQCLDTARKNLN